MMKVLSDGGGGGVSPIAVCCTRPEWRDGYLTTYIHAFSWLVKHEPSNPLNHSSTQPLIHSSTHPLIHSSTHPLIHSSTHPLIHSSTHPLIHSSTHPLIHSSTHPLIHSSTHPLIHSSTHPLIHSSTHPLIHSSTHPLIHSSTHPLMLTRASPGHLYQQQPGHDALCVTTHPPIATGLASWASRRQNPQHLIIWIFLIKTNPPDRPLCYRRWRKLEILKRKGGQRQQWRSTVTVPLSGLRLCCFLWAASMSHFWLVTV
ncbi:hypothetical protein B0T21DRAFT_75723 [Apiosordaria backusii]|uniref:Uncharacterized protein n=1 Tax=Apiosordaria backusii TaxID=314023 RepID=A0AA40DSX9_9PEZI|nr:hypothetical protein B0T21DRAFT_75723 [Apiosordaria backusii]